MDEGRKRVLLITASILAARKLAQTDGRPSASAEAAIAIPERPAGIGMCNAVCQ